MLPEFVREACFGRKSTLFPTNTHFFDEFLQHYWQESSNGDSFVSQSRFDAYADAILIGWLFKDKKKIPMTVKHIVWNSSHGLK